jgi:hypothetical protein
LAVSYFTDDPDWKDLFPGVSRKARMTRALHELPPRIFPPLRGTLWWRKEVKDGPDEQ